MKTGNIGNTPNQFTQFQNAPKTGKPDGKPDGNNAFTNPVDTFTPSAALQSDRPGLKGAANAAEVNRLWNETNHAIDAVRKLVQSMLGKSDATGQGFWAVRAGGNFQLSEADRAQAQELISDDGFFGVQQTTDRIMGFAKALVGEGASEKQIESMRAAVQKGFDEVARMFGGFDNLPDVTKRTHAAIMEAFDKWIAGDQEAA